MGNEITTLVAGPLAVPGTGRQQIRKTNSAPMALIQPPTAAQQTSIQGAMAALALGAAKASSSSGANAANIAATNEGKMWRTGVKSGAAVTSALVDTSGAIVHQHVRNKYDVELQKAKQEGLNARNDLKMNKELTMQKRQNEADIRLAEEATKKVALHEFGATLRTGVNAECQKHLVNAIVMDRIMERQSQKEHNLPPLAPIEFDLAACLTDNGGLLPNLPNRQQQQQEAANGNANLPSNAAGSSKVLSRNGKMQQRGYQLNDGPWVSPAPIFTLAPKVRRNQSLQSRNTKAISEEWSKN